MMCSSVNTVCPCLFLMFSWGTQMVTLWVGGVVMLQEDLKCVTHLALFFSHPRSSSLFQQLFSCLSWELEPDCFFFPILASQAGTHGLPIIHEHTPFFFKSGTAPAHSRLAADSVLTSIWTRLRRKYSHSAFQALWLHVHIAVREPPDCLEKCFHGKTSARLSLNTSVSWPLVWAAFRPWHFLKFQVTDWTLADCRPSLCWCFKICVAYFRSVIAAIPWVKACL